MKLKRAVTMIVIFAVTLLTGCTLFTGTDGILTLDVPESGYPPFEGTLTAGGVLNGTYTFEVEGRTYTQPQNVLTVTIYSLPCDVKVTWIGSDIPQEVTKTIGLENGGPSIGRPVLNAITNLWTIHPRSRYIVTFPDAHDPQGGDVTLINATVFHTGQQSENTVFCPPYTGMHPPKPDVYHVKDGNGTLENAFMFFSIWDGDIDVNINDFDEWKDTTDYVYGDTVQYGGKGYKCILAHEASALPTRAKYWALIGTVISGTGLPYSPPDQGVRGYPGAGTCGLQWTKEFISAGMTIITATFEDEMGATTTESWSIPTMVYPGCS